MCCMMHTLSSCRNHLASHCCTTNLKGWPYLQKKSYRSNNYDTAQYSHISCSCLHIATPNAACRLHIWLQHFARGGLVWTAPAAWQNHTDCAMQGVCQWFNWRTAAAESP